MQTETVFDSPFFVLFELQKLRVKDPLERCRKLLDQRAILFPESPDERAVDVKHPHDLSTEV